MGQLQMGEVALDGSGPSTGEVTGTSLVHELIPLLLPISAACWDLEQYAVKEQTTSLVYLPLL